MLLLGRGEHVRLPPKEDDRDPGINVWFAVSTTSGRYRRLWFEFGQVLPCAQCLYCMFPAVIILSFVAVSLNCASKCTCLKSHHSLSLVQVPSMLTTSLNAEALQYLQGYLQVATVQLV